ncbi:hypothetical protein LWI29_014434 [Acer saccharum]|uniref:DUF1985 domain-containing protein n=1 Tax=Acer saccharum TaxID=4024 RepID=A0AA39RH40_ACESA|nr:hypothetical protein LWI29_014434 [Acer saccharum]
MKFSTGIVHRLLIRELHHDGPEDEMRFLLGKHSVRFSKVEFCLITGLKFGQLPDTSTYDVVPNGIHQRYFESRDEVEFGELRAVVRTGGFVEQYDAVKLCLLYMLNWILMGLDEREKVPLWQFRLIKNLDAFDAFPWGAHVYRRSISGFKHALDGRRERFEKRQREKGIEVHKVETYNIYGCTYALLIFAFEVIPDLAIEDCGTRREIKLSPRILKWELSQRLRGDKLDSIFIERSWLNGTMRALRREGGSLYDADAEHRTIAEPNDTKGPYSRPSDTEYPHSGPSDTDGSDVEGRSRSPVRHRRDRRYTELLDAFRELRVEVQRNEKKRDQQHQELLDLIRGLQGSTAQTPTEGRRSDDPPVDDPSIDDQDQHFSDRDWTGSHQDGADLQSGRQLHPSTQTVSDQQGLGVPPREEVTGGLGTECLHTAHPSG